MRGHCPSRDALRRFLAGTASPEERREIEQHLRQGCQICRSFLVPGYSLPSDALRRFLTGTAQLGDRREVARHLLQGCRNCSSFFRSVRPPDWSVSPLPAMGLSYDRAFERAQAIVAAGLDTTAGRSEVSSHSTRQLNQDDSIEEIVGQLRAGIRFEENFQLLFDRFHWPLFRFFKKKGFSTEECQDLIQETFLRVYRGIGSFRGDARFGHWLFRIADNTMGKALRRDAACKRAGRTISLECEEGSRSEEVCGHLRTPESQAPLRRLLDKERVELLERAIRGLPDRMARCVRLRVFYDLDYDMIAEALQISPATVKVHLFKARKRLHMELGDFFTDPDL